MAKYILRNITPYDINLGDLGYTIPAYKSRDLLSKTSRLKYDSVMKSAISGSISKKLGRSLVEVKEIVVVPEQMKTLAEPTPIEFPNQVKTSLVIDVGELTDEIQEQIITDEEDLLKQLEVSYEAEVAPVVHKEEKPKFKKAKQKFDKE